MSEEANRALVTAIDALPSVPAAAKPGLLKGLSYLLGGLSNYLGAWLRRPVQSVEDRTDARTVITRAIAQAAADKLSHDPEIVSAAIAHWGPADLSRQLNKMKIAKETLKELNSFAESDEEIDSERENSPPSDDFLNSFERFCSDSSDEKMQTLWARLLAGEIRRPGSFSRHTMRRLYELDSETAQLFEKVAMRTVGLVLLSDDDEFKSYELNELQTAGLLTGAGGVFNYTLKFNDEGIATLRGQENLLIAKRAQNGHDFTITSYPLSSTGAELLSLLPKYDERAALREMGKRIPTNVAAEIQLVPYKEEGDKLKLGSTEKLRDADGDATA